MVAMTSSVAGLRDLNVRPEEDGTRLPSIRSWCGLRRNSAAAVSGVKSYATDIIFPPKLVLERRRLFAAVNMILIAYGAFIYELDFIIRVGTCCISRSKPSGDFKRRTARRMSS